MLSVFLIFITINKRNIKNHNMSNSNTNVLEFLEIVGKLKNTVRKGWELRNISEPECVAGHMYRMAIITFLLDEKDDLNRVKCMELALVHDLAEALIGDITPLCGVDPVEKHRIEDEAMMQITNLIGERGQYMYKLYKEYETQSSAEARFVKDIDRFDMVLQAFEYEKRDKKPQSLQEFFDATKNKFKHPKIVSLCSELNKQRSAFSETSQNGQE